MRMSAREIENRAAEWVVRSQAHASTQEQALLGQWLEEDPRHRVAYLRLQAIWGKTGRLKGLKALDGRIDADLLKSPVAPSRWPSMRTRMTALAAVLMIFVAAAAVWRLDQSHWQTHVTERSGFARVTLRDGSTVDLNGDSQIQVRLTQARREVVLVRGEGHFIVARDAQRPFTVTAGGRIVRAVGTAFSVRLEEGRRVDVLVTEGRVAVEQGSAIGAGEAVTLDKGAVTVRRVEAEEVTRRLAWASERLYFVGEPLGEAVAQFNRYTTRKLVLADPVLSQLRIGGNFRATDADAFVHALHDSFGIESEEAEGVLRLRKAGAVPP